MSALREMTPREWISFGVICAGFSSIFLYLLYTLWRHGDEDDWR